MHEERPGQAAAMILGAMAALGLFDNFVGLIARDMGLWQFHLMRAAMALAALGVLAALGLVRLGAQRPWAVMLRGGFLALSMLIYFGSLGFLSVSEVAAGLFTAPIWTLLFSAVIQRKRVGGAQVAAAVLGFVGVLMVLDPLGHGVRPLALIPLAAGFFYAIGSVATRTWCTGESAFAMLAWFFVVLGAMGAVGLAVLTLWPLPVPEGAPGFALRGWVWPVSGTALGLTVLQAGAAIAAVGTIMRAYQLGEAAFVASFEYSLLIFAAFWSWILWGDVPGAQAIAGMALIIVTGAALVLVAPRAPGEGAP